MMALVSPRWPRVDELLSIIALFHLANLELLWSVPVPEGHAQLFLLIVHDGLVRASDEVLWM